MMNYVKFPLMILLSIALIGPAALVSAAVPVQGSTALERGFRTGYSDGYNAGFKDLADNAPRNYQNKEEYQRADRSFNDVWGPIEDYRDGYQQGFEKGYAAGFDHQQFDSSIPGGLRRRQQQQQQPVAAVDNNGNVAPNNYPTANDNTKANDNAKANDNTTVPVQTGSLSIPRNTILALELLTPLSTDISQRGDHFQARVTEPAEYAGAIVEGRVTQVKRPGKVKGVAQLQLSFEQIRTTDNRVSSLHAELVEVVPMTPDGPSSVDPEGGVKGRDSTKDDATKIGAATGIGAIIGAIAGGGSGAAIGAIIGGGAGTAGVMTQRGKDIRLDRGQQMKIRTSADTNVQ
jgi:hypothetical protein